MNKYHITSIGHNGQGDGRPDVVMAKSLRGAMRIATRDADGTRCHLTVEGPDGTATRDTVDTFAGCCYGWQPWQVV